MKLTFVTGNANKLLEVEKLLGADLNSHKVDLPEMQGSYQEIVSAKVAAAAEVVNGPVCVDDTSLEFEAFGKELPGPYIKWFLTELKPEGLVRMLAGFENKNANAVCSVGYCAGPGEKPVVFTAKVHGKIVDPRGPQNFGWDCIFQPDNYDQTYSEMDKALKNQISHRGKAFRVLKQHLNF